MKIRANKLAKFSRIFAQNGGNMLDFWIKYILAGSDGVQEAGGSNPLTQTNENPQDIRSVSYTHLPRPGRRRSRARQISQPKAKPSTRVKSRYPAACGWMR